MPDHWLDIVICALLVLTIAHLFLVQRRLARFRAERDRLQAFVTALDLTVERAEAAIRKLKQVQGVGLEPSPGPTVVRPRQPEDLVKVGPQPRERRPAQPPATAPAAADADAGKGGLAALLKSVAGQG